MTSKGKDRFQMDINDLIHSTLSNFERANGNQLLLIPGYMSKVLYSSYLELHEQIENKLLWNATKLSRFWWFGVAVATTVTAKIVELLRMVEERLYSLFQRIEPCQRGLFVLCGDQHQR